MLPCKLDELTLIDGSADWECLPTFYTNMSDYCVVATVGNWDEE